MKLNKLGEYIELVDKRNKEGMFSEKAVKGISTSKNFIETKADLNGVSLNNYKIVEKNQFAYVADTSRRGEKIGLAYAEETCIISNIYTTFKVKDESKLLPKYLMMYFNRPEFDRYARYNSWGSARETFSWEDLCDTEIVIPSIEVQNKYVAIYNAMKRKLVAYENGLNDLKYMCNLYIEKIKKSSEKETIGKYIEQIKEKNTKECIKDVYGVSNTLQFVTASSTVDRENLRNYKIVLNQDIAYVPTTHMKIWAVAISSKTKPFVVSPIYEVFRIKDKKKIIPEYLFLWLCRDETIRYVFYNSWGSARENFNYEDMSNINLPIPDINIQRNIVKIYKVYENRKDYYRQLKEKTSKICPILIKASISE